MAAHSSPFTRPSASYPFLFIVHTLQRLCYHSISVPLSSLTSFFSLFHGIIGHGAVSGFRLGFMIIRAFRPFLGCCRLEFGVDVPLVEAMFQMAHCSYTSPPSR